MPLKQGWPGRGGRKLYCTHSPPAYEWERLPKRPPRCPRCRRVVLTIIGYWDTGHAFLDGGVPFKGWKVSKSYEGVRHDDV